MTKNATLTKYYNALTSAMQVHGFNTATATEDQRVLLHKSSQTLFGKENAWSDLTVFVPLSTFTFGKKGLPKTLATAGGWQGAGCTMAHYLALIKGEKKALKSNCKPHPQALTALAMGYIPLHNNDAGFVAFVPTNVALKPIATKKCKQAQDLRAQIASRPKAK